MQSGLRRSRSMRSPASGRSERWMLMFLLSVLSVHSFQTRFPCVYESKHSYVGRIGSRSKPSNQGLKVTSDGNDAKKDDEVRRLKGEAARIRLEAEKMDWELTLSKINTLQKTIEKLKRPKEGKPDSSIDDAIAKLDEQIRILQKKLGDKAQSFSNRTDDKSRNEKLGALSDEVALISSDMVSGKFIASASTFGKSGKPLVVAIDKSDGVIVSSSGNVLATTDASSILLPMGKQKQASAKATNTAPPSTFTNENEDDVFCVFDKADLDLYMPVALQLEDSMPNATADERLEAFRASPALQENFKQKLTQLIIEPMQEINRLQELRQQYLDSTSSKEKELLKRQIDAITASLEQEGPFSYSDSVFREIPELTANDLQTRVSAVAALPEVLQTLYKKRYNLESDANLTLAVLLDHYEMQLQLLEQVKEIAPLTEEVRSQVVQALESLPAVVRDHIAVVTGLEKESYTLDDLVVELSTTEDDDDEIDWGVDWNPWNQIVAATTPVSSKTTSLTGVDWTALDIPDDNDIEMVDRSRYVYDFYPAVARMNFGGSLIEKETAEKFALSVLDKKAFMVTNKVERVAGGYYIRGRNLIDGDSSGVKLMAEVEKRLLSTKAIFGINEEFEYFYIRDPAPLTDEELELEYRNDPLFVITGKNASRFYNVARPFTKAAVSTLALASMVFFAVGALGLTQFFLGEFEAAIGLAAFEHEEIDGSLLASNIFQLLVPLLALQLAHEIGHRYVAWRDKFDVGLPTFIPSLQLGCLGTITPITSPPPNLKSMFDFGMAGPLVGLMASVAFLAIGLSLTASTDLQYQSILPTVPTYILRSSTMGGALIEWFIGPNSLAPGLTSSSRLPLHPCAIAGFIGMLSNALALLPLGNTDGGRISIAMFGRRGTAVIKTFTAVVLCGSGLFGFDDSGLLLNYVLLAILWQNELEAPARNEVEELDFRRGCVAIAMAFTVILILLPMTS